MMTDDVTVECLELKDRYKWCIAVNSIRHDFSHTHDFNAISERNGEGLALLFVCHSADGAVVGLWPVLRREIAGTNFFDFNSVYGYAGPVFLNSNWVSIVYDAILVEMASRGAVCLFSRIHPFLFNSDLISSEIFHHSDIVVVDTRGSNKPFSGYRGGHRREIEKAIRLGVKVNIISDSDCLQRFKRIYWETMSYVGADDYYLFDDQYLNSILCAEDFKSFVVFANYEGVDIGASIFIVVGDVMHYYLSGTLKDYRRLSPAKVIIAKVHEFAIGMGMNFLVLGGGVGGRIDDLFKFKAGFSDLRMPFRVVKKVLNQDIYDQLCIDREPLSIDSSFFPVYRR